MNTVINPWAPTLFWKMNEQLIAVGKNIDLTLGKTKNILPESSLKSFYIGIDMH